MGRVADPPSPQVMWYNPASGAWQEVATTPDPATRTVTAQVSHFSLYALVRSGAATTVQTIAASQSSAPAGQETGAAPSGAPPYLALLRAGVVVIVRALIGAVYFLRRSR